jgi:hypothetical protein
LNEKTIAAMPVRSFFDIDTKKTESFCFPSF